MQIPESVKIGPYTYQVIAHEGHLHGEDDRRLAGQIDYNALQIRVVADIHATRRGETFVHECVHAIDNFMETDLTEEQVSRLSAGLYAFLLDNHLLREE